MPGTAWPKPRAAGETDGSRIPWQEATSPRFWGQQGRGRSSGPCLCRGGAARSVAGTLQEKGGSTSRVLLSFPFLLQDERFWSLSPSPALGTKPQEGGDSPKSLSGRGLWDRATRLAAAQQDCSFPRTRRRML